MIPDVSGKEDLSNKVSILTGNESDTTKYPNCKAVADAIAALPEPMVFRGTIGTNGDTTTVPSSPVEGDTYKIIEGGQSLTFLGISDTIKIGDTVIYKNSTVGWSLIPSGDEPRGTVTAVTTGAGLNTTSDDTGTDGGTISSSGTIHLTKSGVAAGTYQGLTVDKYGRVTTASNQNYGTYSKPSGGIPASDLANGVIPDVSNFITKSVNDLANYYLKNETYTKDEVASLIGSIQQFHYEIAASTSAVSSPASNVLYLIGPTGSGSDKYEEYIYANNTWIKIGDTSIDLSGYVTITALNTALSNYWPKSDVVNITLADVAVSGDWADLLNNPIPTPSASDNGKVLGVTDAQGTLGWVEGGGGGSGSVTSVGLSVPTGLQVSGSPITASGTLAVTFQSGYSIPTDAKQTSWDAKYDKPSGGIPATDIAAGVIPDVTGKEDKTNKVTSLSSSSTDTQYPSAKAVYDELQDKLSISDGAQADTLDIETAPTANSNNLVTSGGVAAALAAKYEKPSTGIPASDLADGVIPTQVELTTNIINSLWEAAS